MSTRELKENSIDQIANNLFVKILIAIIGIGGTAVTIYAAFFQEKNCNLNFEIISNTNVLDINTEIGKVDILFDGYSLKERKENIRVVNIRVINNGNKDILKDFYDEDYPIGIKVNEGYLVEIPELLAASSPYLKENINITRVDSALCNFSSAIIEQGEFFTIKLLVLHPIDKIPDFESTGKIAGQQSIEVVMYEPDDISIPFWKESFGGSIWIQLIRLVVYFLIVVFIILAIVWIDEYFDNRKERKTKEKVVRNFKSTKNYQYSKMDDVIFDKYHSVGDSFIKPCLLATKDEDDLNKRYQYIVTRLRKEPEENEDYRDVRYYRKNKISREWDSINEMIEDGLIIKQGEKLLINLAMRSSLAKFYNYLKEENIITDDKYTFANTLS